MLKIKTNIKKLAVKLYKGQEGELPTLITIGGFAVVMVLVVVGAMTFAPATTQQYWTQITDWAIQQFGVH